MTVQSSFFVRPFEGVSFGPPRSLLAGETTVRPTELPSPTTFQGLVRTHLLRAVQGPALDLSRRTDEAARHELQKQIANLVGPPEQLPDGWQLRGPFVAQNTPGQPIRPWVAVPRFLLQGKGVPMPVWPTSTRHPGINDLHPSQDGTAPLLLGRPELGLAEPLSGYIGPDNLRWALTIGARRNGAPGWDPDQHTRKLPPFVKKESRPGLMIERGRGAAAESMLFFQQWLRFKDAGLFGALTFTPGQRIPPKALHQGTSPTGRNARLVSFEPAEDLDPAWQEAMAGKHLPGKVNEHDSFYLFALTPVRLSDGQHPKVRPLSGGVELHYRSALTGAPIILGGFDIASWRSRENHAYAPAGSCWLFQLRGGDEKSRAHALKNELHNRHPLGPANEATFGYGHTLVALGPDLPTDSGRKS
jgi:CRISPR-associated protein Cmr3